MSHCHHDHANQPVFNKIVPSVQKIANALLKDAKVLELTFDQRQEIPHDCVAQDGTKLICHVDEPVEAGDRLISTENQWVIIAAATEELFEVARNHSAFETFIHIAGLNMWPVELTNEGAKVIASHECQHMLEHYELSFKKINAPIFEINVPEVKQHDCCGHDHDHHEHHDHKHDNHDHGNCGHDHH